MNGDEKTAGAFAKSWNTLPEGSIYTVEQFEDWLSPITREDVNKRRILELGCGNGSLMLHIINWTPAFLEGVDLGDSVLSARSNLAKTRFANWKITQMDLTEFDSQTFDIVYCIGVIHHLKQPRKGFESVIKNVKSGGRFHCWVYAREGNLFIRLFIEPLRRLFSRCPWWVTKYFAATPLAVPYFFYAKTLSLLKDIRFMRAFPLYEYSLWIARRGFLFFRHVAFDQLVTPQTAYIARENIENWLASFSQIDKSSVYLILRNGNSWKFGGKVK